jgi:hypothetical protein
MGTKGRRRREEGCGEENDLDYLGIFTPIVLTASLSTSRTRANGQKNPTRVRQGAPRHSFSSPDGSVYFFRDERLGTVMNECARQEFVSFG